MRIAAVLIGIATLSFNVQAVAQAVDLPPNASRVLSILFPGAAIRSPSLGDLDGDGIEDATALVEYKKDVAVVQRIVVLQGARGGDYTFWVKSGEVGPFSKGVLDVRIERGSLLANFTEATCCEANAQQMQFKYRDGQLRLIGARTVETSSMGGQDLEHDVDLNAATGDRIEKLRVKAREKTVRSKIPVGPALLLDNFDYFELLPWIVNALQYTIDDKFRVKPAPKR